MKLLVFLVVCFALTSTSAALHPDIFARFEADNSVYTTESPAELEEESSFFGALWNHLFANKTIKSSLPSWKRLNSTSTNTITAVTTSPTTTTQALLATNTPMETLNTPIQIQSAALSNTESRFYIVFLVIFFILMLIIFAILSNLNSSNYRKASTETFHHIDMDIDCGLTIDSVAVLEIPTNSINTSKVFYFPGYGKQLSVVREASQEVDV